MKREFKPGDRVVAILDFHESARGDGLSEGTITSVVDEMRAPHDECPTCGCEPERSSYFGWLCVDFDGVRRSTLAPHVCLPWFPDRRPGGSGESA